jgi:hypothetical protein
MSKNSASVQYCNLPQTELGFNFNQLTADPRKLKDCMISFCRGGVCTLYNVLYTYESFCRSFFRQKCKGFRGDFQNCTLSVIYKSLKSIEQILKTLMKTEILQRQIQGCLVGTGDITHQ